MSTPFFLLLSPSSLCGFQNYSFFFDGALKSCFLVLLVSWQFWKLRVCSWLGGFLQYASFRTLKMDKLTNFEVWSLDKVDGNKLLTYMVMPTSSCQSMIIIARCSSKIRVIRKGFCSGLNSPLLFIDLWLVFKLFWLKLARTVDLLGWLRLSASINKIHSWKYWFWK